MQRERAGGINIAYFYHHHHIKWDDFKLVKPTIESIIEFIDDRPIRRK